MNERGPNDIDLGPSDNDQILHVCVMECLFILYLLNVANVFEYLKLVVLKCDVFFRFNFHIQMCEIQFFCYRGGVEYVC
jgi:hypothetical protein